MGSAVTEEKKMKKAFDLSQIAEQRRRSGESWLEFLRVPDMTLGLYVLAAGADDTQTPHTEDEVYYVVSGRALLRVGDEDLEARPGALLFVPANAVHKFHTIREELTTLVFFAPAEGSRGGAR